MENFNCIKLRITTLLFVLLAACGGGGGSSSTTTTGTVTSTLSFNVKSAYASFVTAGVVKTFAVTGTCSGTASLTIAPATTATVFEGITGFSGVNVTTMNYTNCTPATSVSTMTRYYDSNYVPTGSSTTGQYGVFLVAPSLPTSVKVGDAGVIGTQTYYTSNTKATGDGREDNSYVIEADTATTAIFNLISKYYNAAGTLTLTEQDRYRISADNKLTFVSFNLQFANGSTNNLVGN